MIRFDADVAVLGSGFGGSLTALLLDRIGLRPVLIDRGRHPRFAIGESSTPIADFVLHDLTQAYDLPRLKPLISYGTWQQAFPEIVCGLKRGFSYFHHRPHQSFLPCAEHSNELLVAASADDQRADTHWLRADVDAFFAAEVRAAGIPFLDRTEISLSQNGKDWALTGTRSGEPVHGTARFVIDATGPAGVVLRMLGIPHQVAGMATHSRAVYGHWRDVIPWHDRLISQGGSVQDHPFDCDHAALHHILEEGWMWQLRFKNGVTSAGIVFDSAQFPDEASAFPERQWNAVLRRYPSIAAQFEGARRIQPTEGLASTNRMQRRAARIVGDNWVLLPNTAGFVDPLHSTGIAQTLCGIERLILSLAQHWERSTLPAELRKYEQTLRQEIALIDRLVSGGYRARRSFPLFVAFSMLYFAAATTYEHRRAHGTLRSGAAFLCADDADWCRLVDRLWQRLDKLTAQPSLGRAQVVDFEREVAAALEPYNVAGLCDPTARNMYRYTAAPKEH